MLKKTFVWVLSIGLFFLFYKSAINKLRHPYTFNLAMDQYKILPKWSIRFLSPLLIVLELFLAIWLLIPSFRNLAALIGLGLQFVFILAQVKNFGIELKYGCGCFQLNVPQKITLGKVGMNISISLILVLIYVLT